MSDTSFTTSGKTRQKLALLPVALSALFRWPGDEVQLYETDDHSDLRIGRPTSWAGLGLDESGETS